MRLTFTHTEYHADPEREAVWILTADIDAHSFEAKYEGGTVYCTANIQTALTHEGPVKISDIDPRLLAEMEQAAIAWVSEGRESLPIMKIVRSGELREYFAAWRNGCCIATGGHEHCFNALLNFIKSPQTTT